MCRVQNRASRQVDMGMTHGLCLGFRIGLGSGLGLGLGAVSVFDFGLVLGLGLDSLPRVRGEDVAEEACDLD